MTKEHLGMTPAEIWEEEREEAFIKSLLEEQKKELIEKVEGLKVQYETEDFLAERRTGFNIALDQVIQLIKSEDK